MTKLLFTLISLGAVASLFVAALLPFLPEVLRAVLVPAAAIAMAGTLLAYGSLDPRPSPRWYDRATFSALYFSAVVLFVGMASGVDYWYARLGIWCLLAYLVASLALASAIAYHAFGLHEHRRHLSRG
jgi:hypothetical protein